MASAKIIQLPQADLKSNEKVLVTQPYIPPLDKYMHFVEQAFDNKWLTNGGPLLKELTNRLKDYLGVKHLLIVNNGTSALQLAYKLKDLSGKTALTTPFTFPATSTALEWQNVNIRLADIDRDSWNLSASNCKTQIQKGNVDAIVPVNIFGAPCDLEAFDELGKKYDIPIIYDSAQALLSKYKGKSIFDYGDIHCVSFHATKLFHCIEGGALIFKNKEDLQRAESLINFGISEGGIVKEAGINAKMSELHAAMGLCVLDDLDFLVENRQKSVERYHSELSDCVELQTTSYDSYTPPMYMPVKFENEQELLRVNEQLNLHGYSARRYFYPANNKYIDEKRLNDLATNNQITDSILCLPLMHGLQYKHIKNIAKLISF
ncbi:MAG: DegT/DnrJ/EryC1/StrS family aminotransferase [Gammaproteobacteria bacterium]|nr:DegT/DnrJ/EryC1/StrS family aminotransferase [Gammaproteobacteria bacterium]